MNGQTFEIRLSYLNYRLDRLQNSYTWNKEIISVATSWIVNHREKLILKKLLKHPTFSASCVRLYRIIILNHAQIYIVTLCPHSFTYFLLFFLVFVIVNIKSMQIYAISFVSYNTKKIFSSSYFITLNLGKMKRYTNKKYAFIVNQICWP